MASEKLTTYIEKEKKNIERLKKKKAEYEEKLKKSEAKLKHYEMMANNESFNALSTMAQSNGLSVDDILMALQTGDLLGLQEQIEISQKSQQEEIQKMNEEVEGLK